MSSKERRIKKRTTSKPHEHPAGINPDAKVLAAEECKEMTTHPSVNVAGINPDAKFLTADELGDRVQNGEPEEQLYLIYVHTSLGRFLVYLDTTTQQLVYDPLVSDASEPAVNYSTIFKISLAPPGQQPPGGQPAYVIRNYVTSGQAPALTPIARNEYRLRMDAQYPATSQVPDYKVFYIDNLSRRPTSPSQAGRTLLTISVPGQDIYWCPINENSQIAGERLVYAKNTMGQFQIAMVPPSLNIRLPFPLVSLKDAVIKDENGDL